jgi:mannose/fructose/N-acetylgalactosamine-specific phosphotransferase system component IID
VSERFSFRSLWSVGNRSLLVQTGWNFQRLQNLGYAWAIQPALARLYPDKEARVAALRRHLELFNTHPYMVTLVMGGSLRLEEEAVGRGEDAGAQATALKHGLMAPLAAIGDTLFWATLRPLAALVAALTAWMAPDIDLLVPVLIYLTLYNLPHLALRYAGVYQGYVLGPRVADFLRRVDIQGLITALRLSAMIMLGAGLAAFGTLRHPASGAGMPFANNFLFIGAGLLMLMALRLKVSVNKVLAALLAMSVLAELVFPDIR